MSSINMMPLVCLWLLVVWQQLPLPGTEAKRDNQPYLVDQNLLLMQCRMKFCSQDYENCSHANCHKWMARNERLGTCPVAPVVAYSRYMRTIAATQHCRHLCTADVACPAAQKCCHVGCGRSCLPANDLAHIPDAVLPAVPLNVSASQLLYALRSATVTMRMTCTDDSDDFDLMVEVRNHAGYAFKARKLGQWQQIRYEYTMYEATKGRRADGSFGRVAALHMVTVHNLRMGRWYQFRAATVGVNGTRGYSAPSAEFQLKDKPRNPHPPRNFTVDEPPHRLTANDSVYARVSWRPPRSDYPVEKYRLTWELPLSTATITTTTATAQQPPPPPSPTIGSIAQREAIITEPLRYFEFWDLKPNAVYQLQLQALTSFGRRRMKSPLAKLTLSTRIAALSPLEQLNQQQQHQQQQRKHSAAHIHVRLLGTRSGLVARVIRSEHYASSRVYLHLLHDEDVDVDVANDAGARNAATDEATLAFESISMLQPFKLQLDFVALRYESHYVLRMQNAWTREWDRKEFWTPTCVDFRQKHPRVLCDTDGPAALLN